MATASASFDSAGDVSGALSVPPEKVISVSLTSAAFTGVILIEKSGKGGQVLIESVSGSGGALSRTIQYVNDSRKIEDVRLRVQSIAAAQTVAVSLTDVVGGSVYEVPDATGKTLYSVDDSGVLYVLGVAQLSKHFHQTEESISSGASATNLTHSAYHAKVTSSGAGTAQTVNIGNGTGIVVGHRKLVTLVTRTHASDSIVMDHANIAAVDEVFPTASVVMDAAGEFILLEWQGTKWKTIKASSGVVTTGF